MAKGGEYHFWLKLKDERKKVDWQRDVFLRLRFSPSKPGKGDSVRDKATGEITEFDGDWVIGRPAPVGSTC